MSTSHPRELSRLHGVNVMLQSIGAELGRYGADARGLSVTFRYRGAVFTLAEREGYLDGRSAELRCDAPGGVAVLSIRPELSGERFDKLLGCTVDVELGDRAFDERFVVESAPREAAPLLLGTAVRQALSAMPVDDDGPKLSLTPVGLSLCWKGSLSVGLLRGVIDALASVRETAAGLFDGHPDLGTASPFRSGAAGQRAVDPRTRALDLRRLAAARRRFVTVVATATAVSAAVIASVIGGHGIGATLAAMV